jgi:hypothetical protein
MSRSPVFAKPLSILKLKSLGPTVFAVVLAFYAGWPLFAGYGIKTSLDEHNVEGLSARIDFPSVRASLRPAVAAKVDKVITDALRRAGTAGGAFTDQLKAQVMPRIVDGVLAGFVTPEMLIRIHVSGKSFKEALDSMVFERTSQAQGLGGFMIAPEGEGSGGARSKLDEIAGKYGIDVGKVLGGAGAKDVQAEGGGDTSAALSAKGHEANRPKYGLGNIKHFSLTGPLGLSIGVARDANARKPELTAELSFVGGSWIVTGLAPEL